MRQALGHSPWHSQFHSLDLETLQLTERDLHTIGRRLGLHGYSGACARLKEVYDVPLTRD